MTGARQTTLEEHTIGVTSCAFSSDGTCAMKASWESVVRL